MFEKYPLRFVTETQTGESGYPVYRRGDINNGGQVATLNIRGRTVNVTNGSFRIPQYYVDFSTRTLT